MTAIATRRTRLQQVLGEHGATAYLSNAGPDVFYYTGCLDAGGYLLLTVDGEVVFITNAHDAPQAIAETEDVDVRVFMPGESAEALLIRALGEGSGPVLAGSSGLGQACEAANRTVREVPGLTANLRRVKEAGELDLIRQGAKIVEAGMAVIRDGLRPGAREIDVAAEAELTMRRMGASGWGFMAKIESGPKSWMPSTYAGERVVEAGDLVLVDIAPKYRGYYGDFSRTFSIGEPTSEQRQVLEVVLAAEQAGIEAVRAGAVGGDVDDAARGPMRDVELERKFLHHTGHTLGIAGDAFSIFLPGQTAVLQAGECVTVEPGLYLEGVGGARIEDELLVTEDGYELLTTFPKTLASLVLGA